MDSRRKSPSGHRTSKRMTIGPDPTPVCPDQRADVESGGPRMGSGVFRSLQRSARGSLGVRSPRRLWRCGTSGYEAAVPAGASARNRVRDARCRRSADLLGKWKSEWCPRRWEGGRFGFEALVRQNLADDDPVGEQGNQPAESAKRATDQHVDRESWLHELGHRPCLRARRSREPLRERFELATQIRIREQRRQPPRFRKQRRNALGLLLLEAEPGKV